MGKQAVTNVQAGAEGTGRIRAWKPPPLPEARAVDSPKREKILEGMLEAVGAEGYDGTSVRTILDRTGLYRQAFYDNFPDKDECYLAALGRWESRGWKPWWRTARRARRAGAANCAVGSAPCSTGSTPSPISAEV